MTAPTRDTIHAALADPLQPFVWSQGDVDAVADALTPTVQRLIAQAVTTALDDAADDLLRDAAGSPKRFLPSDCVRWLRARAESIR